MAAISVVLQLCLLLICAHLSEPAKVHRKTTDPSSKSINENSVSAAAASVASPETLTDNLLKACTKGNDCSSSHKGGALGYIRCMSTQLDSLPTNCQDMVRTSLRSVVVLGARPCVKEATFPCQNNKRCVDNNSRLLADLCHLRHLAEKSKKQMDAVTSASLLTAADSQTLMNTCMASSTCGSEQDPNNVLRCLTAHSNSSSVECHTQLLDKLEMAAKAGASPCRQEAKVFCNAQKQCLESKYKTLAIACQLRYQYGGPEDLQRFHKKGSKRTGK